ncbi:MAG: restriction endonuclease subunit R [Methylibium sp. NZG]|nr:MAG: restriction endonuclease subunit R [Methylibium sp. NZG]
MTPEQLARLHIDAMLADAGWVVQDYTAYNPGVAVGAAGGIALREVPLQSGRCDYLLLVNRQPVGVIEAKRAGTLLVGVAEQSAHYAAHIPAFFKVSASELPFAYESTGTETYFRDARDPAPRSRAVFAFHQPATLAAWVAEPGTLRARLQRLPALDTTRMRDCQIEAVNNLDVSLAADRPRALVQMATGSGKTYTAITTIYRLLKHAKAERVLFLVDRGNLGTGAMREFNDYVTPDDGRKFTELYNVQLVQSNRWDPVCKVTICTIQRMYSMLRGEAELADELDEHSSFELATDGKPKDVAYNPGLPIEAFDFIVTDECHRSIYHLWRQVLEYFDAHLIGLTATPSKQTIGFFNGNLVMEYNHERAVADGVNVGYDVYRIKTEVTAQGGKVEAGFHVDKRNRLDRATRWQQLDEDLEYEARQLDRSVVVPSQIRTVLQAFKDALPALFDQRAMVPKTLVFAKDDSHAEDIVRIAREVFGRGNDFCKKITYMSYDPGTMQREKPETMIATFRNSPATRIAVTVDMIATGTDIKPLECLLFMRDVKSRAYFEQMKGRGTRTVSPTELQAVSGADAKAKTRFVIVDAVGVCESDKTDSRPMERKPGVSFDKLMLGLAFGNRDDDALLSLANRIARLDREVDMPQRQQVVGACGQTLSELTHRLLDATDPDRIASHAATTGTDHVAAKAALVATACAPFDNPLLRDTLSACKREAEQTIDTVTQDVVLEAGLDAAAKERAQSLTSNFRDWIEQHRAEIEALQILYSRPYRKRLSEDALKELEAKLAHSPGHFTPDGLWHAFEVADRQAVKRKPGFVPRFTDLVSLVRLAWQQQPTLEPFEDHVASRFNAWRLAKQQRGTVFSDEECAWLNRMRDAIAASGSVDRDYFQSANELGRVYRVFGERLWPLMDELNEALVG